MGMLKGMKTKIALKGIFTMATLFGVLFPTSNYLNCNDYRQLVNAKYENGWTCEWLFVKSLISYDHTVMTYKILHDLCPENLRHKFTKRSTISVYSPGIIEICKSPKLS